MFACRVCCYNAFNSDELDGIFYLNSDEYLDDISCAIFSASDSPGRRETSSRKRRRSGAATALSRISA